MYRELIWANAVNDEPIKLGAPCEEKEIEAVERYVGFELPEELKALLREINGDGWLLLSADAMIENVKSHREYLTDCFDSREEYEERVDRHIFFATNGCGDYYCYKIRPDGTADTSAILIWEHEMFECRYAARDIEDLIVRYYGGEI